MTSKLKMAHVLVLALAFVLLLGLNLAMAVALKIPMRLELTILSRTHGTSAVITVKNENKHIEQVHF